MMAVSSWKYVRASVRGTSHERADEPCQDVAEAVVERAHDSEVLVVVACDGAGSATHAQLGATETASCVRAHISTVLHLGVAVEALTRDVAIDIVAAAQQRLRALATAHSVAMRELACTLVVGVAAKDAAAFFQVGDGAVIVGAGDEFSSVFWPESGEYANMTSFVSDDHARAHLQHAVCRHGVDEVAVFTDGIQHLVLDYRTRAAHAPFFQRVMTPLRACSETGHVPELSAALARYLASPSINQRTNDDKTLILASRRTVASP